MKGIERCGVVLTEGRQDINLPELRLIAELDHSLAAYLPRQDIQEAQLPSEPQLIAERDHMTGEWPPPRISPEQNKKVELSLLFNQT